MNDPQAFRVCVVDDEPLFLDLVKKVLAGGCEVECFTSAEACLLREQTHAPDLYLLDVRMPGMDGYELCRALKDCSSSADIPVTFLSGLDSIEARLHGYEAGGEDFIVKPFEPAELLSKVEVARRIRTEKRQLREMAGDAQRTAFSAMSSMGELGTVIEFLRKSFACTDGPALAQAILAALDQYGLQGAVQVRLGGTEFNLSPEGSNLPLEVSILNHVRDQGRIFEFKTRSVYNYGGITVLVKNMPLDDADRCGRIRDNLAILAEGADARRQAIEAEAATCRARAGIGDALTRIRNALDTLRRRHQEEQCTSTQLMVEIQEGLFKSFAPLGLTDRQEQNMIDLVRTQFDRLQAGSASSHEVSAALEGLAADLGKLVV
jgi:CheY-like chemotaxis protein